MAFLLLCLCTAFIHLSSELEMKVKYKAGKRGCFTWHFCLVWRCTYCNYHPFPSPYTDTPHWDSGRQFNFIDVKDDNENHV